ncbi:hypothetical protein DPMN_063663 [Dreissena polymorpha]|uniref:Uncharacterized protein n=1 Tax=Dreissena polymorpha TaxID=45954 RepID=A0A9D4CBT1_DREPO|nr:hypothetical protein DPMN_063663 [Dreissena polymorpha]
MIATPSANSGDELYINSDFHKWPGVDPKPRGLKCNASSSAYSVGGDSGQDGQTDSQQRYPQYPLECGNRILKAFANSLDPNETPQNMASHQDPNSSRKKALANSVDPDETLLLIRVCAACLKEFLVHPVVLMAELALREITPMAELALREITNELSEDKVGNSSCALSAEQGQTDRKDASSCCCGILELVVMAQITPDR